jgi:GNAT superfamily N-acetyltransferase
MDDILDRIENPRHDPAQHAKAPVSRLVGCEPDRFNAGRMTGEGMTARAVEVGEIDALAQLWHDGWQDAHAKLAPPGLVRARTLAIFRERLTAAHDDTRVVGPIGAPLGFFMLKDDELYQFYVAREARGSGAAAALIADAEALLAARRIATAWLACAVGNDRAARFYEKCGWRRARTTVNRLETADGVFEVDIWRYEKRVAA